MPSFPVGTEFLVRGVAHRDDQVTLTQDLPIPTGFARPSRRPWRRPVLTARGCTLAAGWVPADTAGTALIAFQRAAANWDRAEFAVQTNTTRGGPRPSVPTDRSAAAAAHTVGSSRQSWT